MADEPIKLTVQDTPDKFRALAEEAARFLAGVLGELGEEITDTQMWKAKSQARFAALLDPYCTEKHIAQRRECLHSTHFPSSFSCIKTGCELVVTAKSAKKAEVWVIPAKGPIPFDLRDADTRYLVEDARGSGHSAQFYDYFQKFRFVLRREGEGWRIDEVYSAAASQDRYRRDFYF